MLEQELMLSTPDGETEAFLYQPEDSGQWPGVIHLTDIGGIRPAHREMAKRLAAKGYVVLMPNVFYRTSKLPVFNFKFQINDERTMKRIGELATPLTPEAMVRDASAYVDFLSSHKAVRGAGLGVVGYCFTGAMALRSAAARPDVIRAAASLHGGWLFTDAPHSPHTVLPQVKARLYFGHAVEDNTMPKEAIEKLEAALAAWGGSYQSETYEGAYHSWTVPDSPVHHPAQAERAFEKVTALFAETLS